MKEKKVFRLPKKMRRPSLFWDVDVNKIDFEKYAWYVAERIMDFGNPYEVAWALRTYPRALFLDIIARSRVLFPTTRHVWAHMCNSPLQLRFCTKKFYHWNQRPPGTQWDWQPPLTKNSRS